MILCVISELYPRMCYRNNLRATPINKLDMKDSVISLIDNLSGSRSQYNYDNTSVGRKIMGEIIMPPPHQGEGGHISFSADPRRLRRHDSLYIC